MARSRRVQRGFASWGGYGRQRRRGSPTPDHSAGELRSAPLAAHARRQQAFRTRRLARVRPFLRASPKTATWSGSGRGSNKRRSTPSTAVYKHRELVDGDFADYRLRIKGPGYPAGNAACQRFEAGLPVAALGWAAAPASALAENPGVQTRATQQSDVPATTRSCMFGPRCASRGQALPLRVPPGVSGRVGAREPCRFIRVPFWIFCLTRSAADAKSIVTGRAIGRRSDRSSFRRLTAHIETLIS
jgi:hypothetical protein